MEKLLSYLIISRIIISLIFSLRRTQKLCAGKENQQANMGCKPMCRRWQKAAPLRRKRISLPKASASQGQPNSSEVPCRAGKGNYVVYTMDQRRFEFPIKYLSNFIIRKLLWLSEKSLVYTEIAPSNCHVIQPPQRTTSIIQGIDRGDMPKDDSIISFAVNRCSLSTSNL